MAYAPTISCRSRTFFMQDVVYPVPRNGRSQSKSSSASTAMAQTGRLDRATENVTLGNRETPVEQFETPA